MARLTGSEFRVAILHLDQSLQYLDKARRAAGEDERILIIMTKIRELKNILAREQDKQGG